MVTPRDNTMQAAAAPAASEVRAEVKSCRASKVQAPEIAYTTVTSVHLLILDASVQLMGKFVKLATSQIISLDPELARRKQSVNCKLNGVKNITSSFSVTNSSNETPWRVSVKLNETDHETSFKIDTGADVSVKSLQTYNNMSPKPPLQKTAAVLRSPGGTLDCKGKIEVTARVKGVDYPLRIYVVSSATECLLSREAAARMRLIRRVDTVKKPEETIFTEFDENPVKCAPVKIRLKDDSQPYSLPTARRVPISLLQKVKDELLKMEETGVIEQIQEPTNWCAGIVIVPKKDGGVRICTDYKKLNTAIKRERYVLPTVEDIPHKLKGSTIFTKLDATSGFWQIPLNDESAKLTTFISPFGRYFYRRLPQGITSAPEIFQRTVEEMIAGEEHAVCFFDDILVFSENEEVREKHFKNTMEKLNSAGIKLNKEKYQFRQQEIDFLGFVINKDGVKADPRKTDQSSKCLTPQM